MTLQRERRYLLAHKQSIFQTEWSNVQITKSILPVDAAIKQHSRHKTHQEIRLILECVCLQRRDTNTHLLPVGQPTFSDRAPRPAPSLAPDMRRGPNNNDMFYYVGTPKAPLPASTLSEVGMRRSICHLFPQFLGNPSGATSQPVVHSQSKHPLEEAC